MSHAALRAGLCLLALLLLAGPAAGSTPKIDLNRATAEELDTLPGIGPGKARAIIEYREANGPFQTIHDLEKIYGIGRATVVNFADRVMVRPLDPSEGPSPEGATDPGSGARTLDGRLPRLDGPPIDLNTADEQALQTLPGIGPTKAWAIVEDRRLRGPFERCAELVRVMGIGPATVVNLGSRCTVEPR